MIVISLIRVMVQMILMRFVMDAVELKRRSFSCLITSGQHGGQRKPADVIINGQLGGNKKRRKLLQKSYMMAFYVHVDEGRGLLGRSVRHYYRYDCQ